MLRHFFNALPFAYVEASVTVTDTAILIMDMNIIILKKIIISPIV